MLYDAYIDVTRLQSANAMKGKASKFTRGRAIYIPGPLINKVLGMVAAFYDKRAGRLSEIESEVIDQKAA